MSIDVVKGKETTNQKNVGQDITWERLIRDSQSQIDSYRKMINRLNKSIIFFKKQADSHVPFPKIISGRHQDLS